MFQRPYMPRWLWNWIMKRLGITADGEESATETGILAEAWD